MKDIIPVKPPGSNKIVSLDNGVRITPPEKMASLKPAFIKPHGTITAANASFLVSVFLFGLGIEICEIVKLMFDF